MELDGSLGLGNRPVWFTTRMRGQPSLLVEPTQANTSCSANTLALRRFCARMGSLWSDSECLSFWPACRPWPVWAGAWGEIEERPCAGSGPLGPGV